MAYFARMTFPYLVTKIHTSFKSFLKKYLQLFFHVVFPISKSTIIARFCFSCIFLGGASMSHLMSLCFAWGSNNSYRRISQLDRAGLYLIHLYNLSVSSTMVGTSSTWKTFADMNLVNVHTGITEVLVVLIADVNLSISGAVAIPLPPPPPTPPPSPPPHLFLLSLLLILLLSLLLSWSRAQKYIAWYKLSTYMGRLGCYMESTGLGSIWYSVR